VIALDKKILNLKSNDVDDKKPKPLDFNGGGENKKLSFLNQISGITQEEEKERNDGLDSAVGLLGSSPVNAAPVKSQKSNNSSKQAKEMEAEMQKNIFGTSKTQKIVNFEPSIELTKPAGDS
jgi:hypothetical protein